MYSFIHCVHANPKNSPRTFITEDGLNRIIKWGSQEILQYYLMSEKYFLYDLRNHAGLKFYDQFLNKYLPMPETNNFGFEEDVVKEYSADKNIIYLQKWKKKKKIKF